ncbi:glycolate oxidase subunit GlcD [Salisediminibacterium halotolerans]|uniref:Glycolate oxidase n=1 Tax=Salisediminibacterium halotolerans TaxID=517425 RepID=A0A1H9S5H7_9BACI|nr:glycolate oxidase subunit GlcD [Salisediminibacterium haloalkalitolerans]SER79409.1 glycolate oxidase [Salisediminibacterium haloalkalitolerans]
MLKQDVRDQLTAIVGEENLLDSQQDLIAYSYDSTPDFQELPDAVIKPRHTEDVSAIMKVLNEEKLPLVPRGNATNLCAGTTPLEGGVVMIFNHMNKLLEIDEENLTATVQPGLITQDLITEVETRGLFYAPDPSSMKISTIGGNINEGSGGLRGLKYGVTRDYVMGLEFVMPNGDIVRTGGKLAKDVAGYDLTRLMIGSEGTLGVLTEATMKLIPKPETKKTMLALYHNLESAGDTVSTIIANKIIPATLEFLDQPTIRVVEDFAQIGLPTDVGAILLIEQDGPPEVVDRDMVKMKEICEQTGAMSADIAATPEEGAALTAARRSALSALARMKPTTILEDATVPRSKVAEMVRAIEEIAEKNNVEICTFGHAGDGNLHPTCMTDARDREEMKRVEQAFEDIFAKAIELGGTITGEHGVGAMKSPYLSWKVGDTGVNVMREIKKAFDPNNIMNPGKMFAKDEKFRVVVEK